MDVLLIFLFVFGFAAWGIWKLYLAARDTYGDNSPLKVERVYKKSAISYFLGFDYVFSYSFLALAGIFLYFLFTMNFSSSGSAAWIGFMLLLTMFMALTFLSAHNILLIHNYWKFTKDVVITSVPDKHEIKLDIAGKEVTLKKDTIESLTIVTNDSRNSFTHFIYHLNNGEKFILTDRMPGLWVIHEYFKKIPIQQTIKLFPYIK
ncbi:hypothetical protein DSL64_20205 [Dyadobacter luteus]|uniref:PH domain-containing protein n=1 Tax=Dyadobacter luteus TaxID=2259619 RepID=A0A3D8Y721_9BACT|nr:hypothetical protein [Dyadobacter luteus]REA58688.1 hypothetical protein DSL64_20205 [Dyadobacter luteus]